jgi:hypothetical protein
MKKAILTISALMISAMISTGAMATVPDLIPVQGVLADSADLPIDALTDITFTLYDGESSSTVLWTDTFVDVDVVEGFFTVYLGDNTALPFASLISNSEVWMGITVESDPEMDRVQLATVPFAIEAQVCQAVGSLTEADLTPASGIAAGDITNWNTAYGWGDHSTVGYLTTETDPVFGASAASGIAAGDITNWDAAYGWGNHSTAGYLTSYTDTNAGTICAAGQFLNGDGSCDAVVVNTNTNSATICSNGYYLNGDATCDIGDASGDCAAGAVCTGGHQHSQYARMDGTCTTVAIISSVCPFGIPAGFHAGYNTIPLCNAVSAGSFCEGNGECGTNDSLNNCGVYDIYIRVD